MHSSSKDNLRHYSLVFMIEEVAVEQRRAPNNWIGEVHRKIYGAHRRHVDRVQPFLLPKPLAITGIQQEVNLMDVERMYLIGPIGDAPMLVGADWNGQHWRRIHRELLAVDVETIFVFRKDSRELRLGLLH